jgi:hypothetical protein
MLKFARIIFCLSIISFFIGCATGSSLSWGQAADAYKNQEIVFFLEEPIGKSYITVSGILLRHDDENVFIGIMPEYPLSFLPRISAAAHDKHIITKQIAGEKEVLVFRIEKNDVIGMCKDSKGTECLYIREDALQRIKDSK